MLAIGGRDNPYTVRVNVIRKAMPDQVEALREPLFAAYTALARYQFDRTDEAERRMRDSISRVVPMLRPFLPLLPRHKRRYLVALEAASEDESLLSASELLLLFDQAVYELHVRLSPRERGQAATPEPWTEALLTLLDERRNFAGPV